MSEFIQSINIETFRGINSLELSELREINILTGDNNSGKTSVLEVIESFRNPGDMRVWRTLLRKNLNESVIFGISDYEGFYNLFDANTDEKRIEYTIFSGNETNKVTLVAREKEEELTKSEIAEIRGFWLKKDLEENTIYDSRQLISKLELEVKINNHLVKTEEVYEGQVKSTKSKIKLRGQEAAKNIVYISPVKHAEGSIYLDEILDIPELYEEMLAILREYDKDIVSINYNRGSDGFAGGFYTILSKSHKKALPLNVYGDGMKKAVMLMGAVVKAKDGILLLDEFETAIHTSAMDKTFRWILETCMKLHVQVFLTSHSKEAINKVLKCSPNLQDKIAVYTLYKDGEGSSVRRLTGKKAIEAQDEMGLELR